MVTCNGLVVHYLYTYLSIKKFFLKYEYNWVFNLRTKAFYSLKFSDIKERKTMELGTLTFSKKLQKQPSQRYSFMTLQISRKV